MAASTSHLLGALWALGGDVAEREIDPADALVRLDMLLSTLALADGAAQTIGGARFVALVTAFREHWAAAGALLIGASDASGWSLVDVDDLVRLSRFPEQRTDWPCAADWWSFSALLRVLARVESESESDATSDSEEDF